MILHLIITPLAAVAITKVVNMWKQKRFPRTWHTFSLKPIDCAFCLSFWLNLLIPYEGPWMEKILTALAAMIIAAFIDLRYE